VQHGKNHIDRQARTPYRQTAGYPGLQNDRAQSGAFDTGLQRQGQVLHQVPPAVPSYSDAAQLETRFTQGVPHRTGRHERYLMLGGAAAE